jgi:hypothetical protein
MAVCRDEEPRSVDCVKRVVVLMVEAISWDAFTTPDLTMIVEREVAIESPRLMKAALEPIWRESTVKEDT